ncbi:MAG: 23S rRNA (adenine(2503)-C(2))-methyltransferase RlmN [Gammaproteobacteria bacterium]|nr:23S rRNA (adenine(2503)-C(2))-methyltransferase RlmN [Gammaproteobacteria bacterium]
MSTPGPVVNLFDLNRSELEDFFESAVAKRYRARQIMKWAYHRLETSFAAMTDISKAHRAWLLDETTLTLPEVVTRQISRDGTIKWVVRVANGNCVEMVLIPERGRNTLCVSSQVGCTLDCSFCATGKQGFNGNLSTADIIGQVWLVERELRKKNENVSNVVLMGMGEPLLNLKAVLAATDLMTDDLAFGLSKRRVTISTSGVVPGIYELAEHTDVSLAISLHAPNDALRNVLVPINKKYPIAELMEACGHYLAGLGEHRTLTIEYTLMRGVNDSLAHAKELAKLLEVLRCKINLIPFNPFPASGYERPRVAEIRAFQTYLINAGYTTMLRTTRGSDIDAACGQLVGRVEDRTRRQKRYLARVKAQEVA